MPKPNAAANAAPMPASSRRAFLKAGAALGTVAALAVPVAVLPKAEASTLDPVFAAITAHAAARALLNGMDSDDGGWDAAMDEEEDLWKAFCACRPASMGGLAAYAAHAAVYPDLEVMTGRYGPAQIITNMAEALHSLGMGGAHV
ncbi:twin-arginine translocation signal domain-containing protein [Xanthobacter wiegelii]|uniref:twin-arginine translocation signal domain-containing protein n=1 Tax=Xanthobacter wiegelii TaxID=3119913 RepID=UPI00372ABEF7